REAAQPVFEADRHAKVRLKAEVRGVRPIERALEGQDDAMAEVARGYCAAVRSAITDDGRPPLAASGLQLKARLEAAADSLDRGCSTATPSPTCRAPTMASSSYSARSATTSAGPQAARWPRPPSCCAARSG